MKVKQLIDKLKEMPEDSEVVMVSESAVRAYCQALWLSVSGRCVISDEDEYIWDAEDFPVGHIGEYYTTGPYTIDRSLNEQE